MHVDALEVLETVRPCDGDNLVFDRYGPYIAVSSSDTTAVHLWTEADTWGGTATEPAEIGALGAAWETATRKP